MTGKELFCSKEFRCYCSASMLFCYVTACQPLTARTEQICTQFCISQFLNSLGNIFTEGQRNNNNNNKSSVLLFLAGSLPQGRELRCSWWPVHLWADRHWDSGNFFNISARQLLSNLSRKISESTGEAREASFLFQRCSVLVQRFNGIGYCFTIVYQPMTALTECSYPRLYFL